eukprot:81981_1
MDLQLKTPLPEIEQDYISNTNTTKYAAQIFKKIARLLNIDSTNNELALFTRYLITCYRQFSLDINEYTTNKLFKQLQCSNSVPKGIPCTAMKHYIGIYEKLVHKPLSCINNKMSIDKYNDNMNVITQYMIRINTKENTYPIQLDVFYVAPDTHKQLNLHALGGLEGVKCNNNSCENTAAIGGAYCLINGQRFIMLIVRGNNDDIINATIYALNFTRNKRMSDYVELMYLLNSKSMIVPGLSPCDACLLGLDCNAVYISYGNYKSRVFKNDILNKLKSVFNWHNDKRHFIINIIAENTKT